MRGLPYWIASWLLQHPEKGEILTLSISLPLRYSEKYLYLGENEKNPDKCILAVDPEPN